MRNPDLWARLQAFEFDKGTGSAPFSVKLARAEGWSTGYTARVIEEYRKFLYLTQVSDRQVTPSVIVDAAWHMHLTFTRDYWEEMCPKVIGKPIHHQPCAGEEEMPRYRDQFAATKALYEAEFGHEPPSDIWARNPVSPLRQFALSEEGSITTSPVFIAFVPFAICLVIAIVDYSHMIAALTVFTGIMFFMVLLNPNRRRRRARRDRRGEDDAVWLDEADGSSSSGSGRSTGRGSKSSRDEDAKGNTGGFWAMFSGDSDGDSGGGCGGCGGD